MKEEKAKLYKCPVCDTVVEMLDKVGLELICCGPVMVPLEPRTSGPGALSHLPAARKDGWGLVVTVGAKGHPMVEDHHVKWIELTFGGKRLRQFLEPGRKPAATFELPPAQRNITVRAYCNVHGLWQTVETLQVPTLNNCPAREIDLDGSGAAARRDLRRRRTVAKLARTTD